MLGKRLEQAVTATRHDIDDTGRHIRGFEILGPRQEAFLYEYRDGQPVFLRYLAKDVRDARFLKEQAGYRLRLDLEDGDFALYDEDGKKVD